MLLNFSFENFKSYGNDAEFTMQANNDTVHEENLIKTKKERVSKARIIYGANASGKTSFIQAIGFVQEFAALSNNLVENSIIGINPYKFRKDPFNKPSKFSLTFIKNGLKYHYSFSCVYDKVIDEKLDIYNSAKPTNVFTRTNTNSYKFNSADSKLLTLISLRNTKNKLFLVTAATWNYTLAKPAVDFILNDIVVMYGIDHPVLYNLNYVNMHGDSEEYKKFCVDFLNEADLSISDISISSKKVKELGKSADTMTKLMNVMVNNNEEQMSRFMDFDVFNIKTLHNLSEDGSSYPLELIEESFGTQQLFYFAPALFYALKEGKTLFIDEIDRSLHPLLVEHIIKKFLDIESNEKNAQLICITHDTNLLNLDIFRRDEIWFASRNYETSISEIYPLSSFSPRKEENVEKGYLLGRYGAIPFIKEY